MNATVVELDALPDANRSAADGNESLLGALVHVGQAIDARGPVRFVGGVVIRCFRSKFSGARVDHAVHGVESDVVTSLHHGALVLTCGEGFETRRRETRQGVSDVSVAEPVTLPQTQLLHRQLGRGNASLNDASFHLRKPFEAVEEPSGDPSDFVDLLHAPSTSEGLEQRTHTAVGGDGQPIDQGGVWKRLVGSLRHPFTLRFIGSGQRSRVGTTLFEGRPCFQEGLLEITTDGHALSGRFHRRTEGAVGGSELVKGPTRNLAHAVVQGGLKRRSGALARDGVGKFVEGVAHGNFCGHSSDGVAGRFGGECARARHPRVHLNHANFTGELVECELNVAAALDVQRSNQRKGLVA